VSNGSEGGPAWLDRWAAPGIFLLHSAVGLYAWRVLGVGMTNDPVRANWDYFWQTIPARLLREDLWRSLWHLHTQPPLYNLWGAFFLRTFGDSALEAMHAAHIALGAMACAMGYAIGRAMGLGRIAAALVAGFVALLPSLVLYEAYALYEILTLFWLTTMVYGFARFERAGYVRREVWLWGGLASLSLLMLTRSSFHLLLWLPVAAVAVVASDKGKRWLTALVAVILILPVAGWYTRNQIEFGFFGASSWAGMNSWRIASEGWDADELKALVADGKIAEVAAHVKEFSLPSQYAPFGFTMQTGDGVLGLDDYSNGAMVSVARDYGRSARALVVADPGRYVQSVAKAYARFNRPTSTYDHLETNRARLPAAWIGLEETLYLTRWMQPWGSLSAWLLPLSLLLYATWWILWRRRTKPGWFGFVIEEPTATLTAGVLTYTVLVSSLLEYGENERFRFVVEPLSWLFIAAVIANVIREVLNADSTTYAEQTETTEPA
jgi:4-amino-4-deoxy-L-arabinose transferase-like glycosyltransferase